VSEKRYDPELAESLCAAVAAFEAVLPTIKSTLGEHHPRVLTAVDAMVKIRQELEAQGYYPRLQ
jgi:hypothetical protein